MNAPLIPANEAQRLASLRDSGLPDVGHCPALDRLTRLAKHVFQVPLAMVNIVDEHTLHVLSRDGEPVNLSPRHSSFCGYAILGDAALVVEDARLDARFADNPLVAGHPGIRFYAGIPLRLRDGACVGTLCVMGNTPRRLSTVELSVLSDLGALAEDEFAAIGAATTDELTGLFNRRGFIQLVHFVLSVARRRAEPLTLGWLDLDRFKTINDRYGHDEGDKALKAMAGLMRAAFREADLLVRFGGDEFAVLFADTDEQGAWIAMQYLAEQVESYNARRLHPWSLHFSWGLSEFDHNANDMQQWLKNADEKMYTMKRQREAAR